MSQVEGMPIPGSPVPSVITRGRKTGARAVGGQHRGSAVRSAVHGRPGAAAEPADDRRQRTRSSPSSTPRVGISGAVIGGLYLAPFAGIMFLWFVAVIRDQIGEREDRFFATVFFGSGLLFVAILFVSVAVASMLSVCVRYLGQGPPSAREVQLAQGLSYTLLFGFGTRAAAVFLLATSTIGIRSSVFPLWFGRTGYLIGVVLLVVVAFWDWVILVLPAWVAMVSLYILRRERARQRMA